jgi:protein-disulfide isomerase
MNNEHNTQQGTDGTQSDGQGKKSSRFLDQQFTLPVSILAAAVLVSASILFVGVAGSKWGSQTAALSDIQPKDEAGANGTAPSVQERDVIMGDPNAPVSIIEYGDYQCPFCVKFFKEAESQIREAYIKTGKVKLVFRNFQFLGPESILAAQAAECAKDQKKFWEFHDGIYLMEERDGQEHNGNLNIQSLTNLASEKGLDVGVFSKCLSVNTYEEQVKKDTTAAQAVGVRSTPTIFVNGQKFEGAYPFENFKQAIETALKK